MAAKISILVAENNPMLLEMLRGSLAPIANVTTATDGSEAFQKATETPPDLIIADYTLPGMDGKQLVEKLKSRPNTSKVPIIIVASRAAITEKLKATQDSVEEFIEKPFYVKETAARIKRIADKIVLEKMAREAAGDGVLRGSLAQMNIMDLFQSLEMGHKTCTLTVSNNGQSCQMFFAEGQIKHAVFGSTVGDKAVYKTLAWKDGSFAIDFNRSSSERTTTKSTQGLLMEGMRLIDEAKRGAENVLDS